MAEFDLKGSIAHVTMLGETGIIAQEEALQIKQGLEELLEEYKLVSWNSMFPTKIFIWI